MMSSFVVCVAAWSGAMRNGERRMESEVDGIRFPIKWFIIIIQHDFSVGIDYYCVWQSRVRTPGHIRSKYISLRTIGRWCATNIDARSINDDVKRRTMVCVCECREHSTKQTRIRLITRAASVRCKSTYLYFFHFLFHLLAIHSRTYSSHATAARTTLFLFFCIHFALIRSVFMALPACRLACHGRCPSLPPRVGSIENGRWKNVYFHFRTHVSSLLGPCRLRAIFRRFTRHSHFPFPSSLRSFCRSVYLPICSSIFDWIDFSVPFVGAMQWKSAGASGFERQNKWKIYFISKKVVVADGISNEISAAHFAASTVNRSDRRGNW